MTIFFVLSGFILSHRYGKFDVRSDYTSFYVARLTRLYPVYIFMAFTTSWTLLANVDRFALAGQGDLGYAIWLLVVVFLMIFALQAWTPSLFGVWNFGGSWSLSVEAFFYSIFPWLRNYFASASAATLLTWLVLSVAATGFVTAALLASLRADNGPAATTFYTVPIYRLPEFIAGIVAYCLFVERRVWRARLSLVALVFAVVALASIYTVDLPGNLDFTFLIIPPLLWALMACFDVDHKIPEGAFRATFNYLGHVSYCVYIVQFGTVPLFKKALAGWDAAHQWAFFIGVNLLLAIIVYHLIEKPARPLFRKLLIGGLHSATSRRLTSEGTS